MTHLILSGHVHANFKKSDTIASSSHLIIGGSTYSGGDYKNNCSILNIDKDEMKVKRTVIEYIPNDDDWEVKYDYECMNLIKKSENI